MAVRPRFQVFRELGAPPMPKPITSGVAKAGVNVRPAAADHEHLGGVVVCTSTTLPTDDVYIGMVAFQTDTAVLAIYTATGWQQVGVAPSGAAWIPFTPVLQAASVNPTLGTNSQSVGRYDRNGRTITGTIFIRFGTAGTAAGTGNYRVVLPVPAKTSTETGNSLYVVANGITTQGTASVPIIGMVEAASGLYCELGYAAGPAAASQRVANNLPAAWTVNESIRLSLRYEAAA